jgi:predicted nucleic acid-binding protein
MIAVSNATPLRYLILIQQEHMFPQLFEKVYVPGEVHRELTQTKTPSRVRHLLESLPAWYEVRQVRRILDLGSSLVLDPGEWETILLAEVLRPDFVLIDDRAGRTVAMERGLPLAGTLGILERADALGLMSDFPGLILELKTHGFFISGEVEAGMLTRHRMRRRTK